jgi:hypothetical protein
MAGPFMLRGAKPKHPSGRSPPGSARRVSASQSVFMLGRTAVYEGRTAASKALGFCGIVLGGGAALFAIWELGNFSVPFGNGPLLPSAVREAPPPGMFRPAGGGPETDGGCTQAPIDRSSGQTTPADCHTWAAGRETLTARLSRPGSSL